MLKVVVDMGIERKVVEGVPGLRQVLFTGLINTRSFIKTRVVSAERAGGNNCL